MTASVKCTDLFIAVRLGIGLWVVINAFVVGFRKQNSISPLYFPFPLNTGASSSNECTVHWSMQEQRDRVRERLTQLHQRTLQPPSPYTTVFNIHTSVQKTPVSIWTVSPSPFCLPVPCYNAVCNTVPEPGSQHTMCQLYLDLQLRFSYWETAICMC